MDTSYQQALIAIFLVILTGVFTGVLFGAIFLVIKKILQLLWEWLLNFHRFARLVSSIKQNIYQWWKRNLPNFGWLFEWLSEIIIEPFLFGYAIFALFNKFQSFTQFVSEHPDASFWQMFNLDARRDVNFYLFLYIVMFVWMFGKALKHRRENRNQKNIEDKLETISKQLTTISKNSKSQNGKHRGAL